MTASAIPISLLAQPPTSPGNAGQPLLWGAFILTLIILLVVFAVLAQFLGLYVRAALSGASVTLVQLLGMRLRKVDALMIVNARIQANRAGLNVSIPQMESHVLAGGNLQRVINAMIIATKADIDLSWKDATAIDLAGRDVLAEVQTSVKQVQPASVIENQQSEALY